jgi:hypothetical protein
MGIREYYTQDFFHNIPDEYERNNKLMQLFEVQDNSVATMKNWVSNFRLFFGLVYLLLKSVGPYGIVISLFLLYLIRKVK